MALIRFFFIDIVKYLLELVWKRCYIAVPK